MRTLVRISLVLAIVAWPPLYSIFVHPLLYPRLDVSFVSTDELKRLLDVRRYIVDVPDELDGFFLAFESLVVL